MIHLMKKYLRIPLVLLLLVGVSYPVNWKLQTLQVFDIIQGNYVQDNISEKTLTYGAIKGMLESLNDPYSRFLEPDKYTEMKSSLAGNFFGIGIHIGMKNNKLTVITPISGTPADKAGIRAMDSIVSINTVTTEKMSLEEAVSLIRGPEGSKVTLWIKRESVETPFAVSIVRAKIDIKSIEDAKILADDVGYLRLNSFESKEATKEMATEIKALKKKGAKHLIIDVRNNGGGLLSNAQGIASLLIDEGVVVYTVDRSGNKLSLPVTPGKKIFDGSVVILINGSSASASEILAGAVRDNHRGKLVGTHSFGKASVQNIIPMSDGSAILLTIAKYLTPNGSNIHTVGIPPDVLVDIPSSDIEAIQKGTFTYSMDKDPQILKAIQVVKSL